MTLNLANALEALIGTVIGGLMGWAGTYWQFTKGERAERHRSDQARAHDARLAVEALICKLEDSELYRVHPHYEIWDKGFDSLYETRVLFRAAKASLRALGNADVLAVTERFEMAHRPLIQLRDSFEQFMAEEGAEGGQRILGAARWPDLPQAEEELRRLQTFVNRELLHLKSVSERLGSSPAA
jgi:hypothetical protein